MFGFAEDTKDMTAAEILNYYRNRYYAEPQVTERGIVANAINDYFKESASKSAWISVKNPPETYRDDYGELIPFLVCCRNTEYPFRAVYDGTTWGDGIGRLKVTHWMPLPEPPKGE